jgi:4'-phosphopantetheinyl transferase
VSAPPRPRTGVDTPALGRRDVHIWLLPLHAGREDVAVLSLSERARASAIRDLGTRARFTATRAAVRGVLAGYLHLTPNAVPLAQRCPYCSEPHGRPVLEGAGPALSVAHSGNLAVLAVTGSGEVGVDVEDGAARVSPLRIAARRFTAEETAGVASATDECGQMERFLRIWTRKEAYLKATGAGLTRPLSSVAVSWTDPPELLRAEDDDVGRWALAALPLPRPMVGAVAHPAGHRLAVFGQPGATDVEWPPSSAGPDPTARAPGTPERRAAATTSGAGG